MWYKMEMAVFFNFFGTGSCRDMNNNSRKEIVLTAGWTAGSGFAGAEKKGAIRLKRC
jgi:hypothetical protein